MRIALMAVLSFAGLWFVVLRPKPVADEPVQAPKPANGVLSAPAKAEEAVGKANATSAAREGTRQAAPASAAKPAAGSRTAAPAARTRPADAGRAANPRSRAVKAVLADLEANRTVVLLFWERGSADDEEVRRVVQRTDRRGGKVRVHVASIRNVGNFEPITRGVPVVLSPTVLVIGPDRRARTIDGLTQTGEIDETVAEAIRAGR
jgi:hypothetical protein